MKQVFVQRALEAVLAGAIAFAPAPQNSPDLFAQIFNRGVLKQQTMHSIRAKFTETTTSSLLVAPIIAHGTVIAAEPARVRMTYTDPDPKTLTMDGKTLSIEWPERHERQDINIVEIQKRIDQYFTHANLDQLRSMFDITAVADPKIPHTDRIEMRPKRKQVKDGLERLELWIDRETDLLVRMRLVFPGGDEKLIALEDITINVPVTDAMFKK